MGELLRAMDWSATPLGPRDTWPQSLRTAASICLENAFPMLLWWGPGLVQIYNDDYRPILGAKHPRSLGQAGRECWAEIWPVIGPMYDDVVRTGLARSATDLLLAIERHGYLEETYFTFSYSPIREEAGTVGGVLVTCTETTERVIGERRLRALRDLGAEAGRAGSADEACARAAAVLDHHAIDLPFAAIYLTEGREQGRLAGAAGLRPGDDAAPEQLDGADPGAPWPIAGALAGDIVTVDASSGGFDDLPGGPWPIPTKQVLLVPIPGPTGTIGVLVAGISPRRRLDAAYRDFLTLVAGHIGSNVATAQAYEAERQRAEALAELDRAKTAFFNNVSHEFRTPLMLQLGPIEDALADEEEPLPPRQRERIAMVQRNSLRLHRLVNALLEISRLQIGRVEASFAPVDLAALTRDIASTFRSAIERVDLALELDCESISAPVYVDPEMWEKIVLNLLSNALKFTFEGSIRVSLRWLDGHVRLEVADTGVGIDAAELPRLFDRFHRIRGQRSRTHEGSGIGLAMVQELARLHGGQVTARSAVGEGTVFTVTIPAGTAHLPPEQLQRAPASAPSGHAARAFVEEAERWLPTATTTVAGRDRVLFVDDNADMRAYVERLLGDRYDVEVAADGEAALASATATPPRLVLTDAMMPGLDGFELLRALRERPATRDVPVVLLSARAGEEARLEGLAAGADDYIVKPFSARELLARVGSALERERVRGAVAGQERQLRLAAERDRRQLQVLFEQAPAMMALLRGPEHVFELVNGPYLEVIERTAAEVLGRSLGEVLPEVVDQGFITTLDRVRQTGRAAEGRAVPLRLVDPDSRVERVRYFDFVYQPIVDAVGVAERVLVHAVDVTDAVLARQRIEDSDRQLRLVTDALPALVAYVSRDGRYRFANARYRDWLGLDPQALVGQTPSAVLGPIAEQLAPRIRSALAGEIVRFDLQMPRREPGTRLLQVTYVPDRDPADGVRGFVMLAIDVTEQRQSEARLVEAQRMEAVGTLAGGVAHEVNNMMTVVIGLGDLVLRRATSHREDLVEMVGAARRAARITQQLLAFSRRQVLAPDVLDIDEVVEGVTAMVGQLLGADITLGLSLGGPGLRVRTDRGQLEQVLVNLALNARDAMPRGGRLTVRTCSRDVRPGGAPDAVPELAPGAYVLLEVEDEGEGMDPDTRARAFEPFFTTKPVGSGTGLGLSMVYGMVTQSGGHVAIDSAPGRGTRVSLWFPLMLAPGEAVAEPTDEAPLGTERILVVEDEELVRELTCRILESAGFEVDSAADGREALERLDSARFDLVLSDLVMPELGGRELHAALRDRGDPVPMVFMSGYTGDHRSRLGLDPDVPLVNKPFEPDRLVLEIRRALDHVERSTR